jgi:hypothetical protein
MVGTSLPSLLSGSNWPRALSGRMPAPVPIVCTRIALTGMVVAEVKGVSGRLSGSLEA